jgi:hypothetical protein
MFSKLLDSSEKHVYVIFIIIIVIIVIIVIFAIIVIIVIIVIIIIIYISYSYSYIYILHAHIPNGALYQQYDTALTKAGLGTPFYGHSHGEGTEKHLLCRKRNRPGSMAVLASFRNLTWELDV